MLHLPPISTIYYLLGILAIACILIAFDTRVRKHTLKRAIWECRVLYYIFALRLLQDIGVHWLTALIIVIGIPLLTDYIRTKTAISK